MYNYMDYLPDYLQKIKELIALGGCVDAQLQELQQEAHQLYLNGFFDTAELSIIARWESILNIYSPLNSTDQARRDAIKAQLMTKPPINLVVLQGIIEAYMGLPVDLSVSGYELDAKYRGNSRIADLAPLIAAVYETIPANLIFHIVYLYVTWGEIKTTYPTWGDVRTRTWGFIHKGV